jgi:hypothetical protein
MIDYWMFNSISSYRKILEKKIIIIISLKINILFINGFGLIIMIFSYLKIHFEVRKKTNPPQP